MRDERVYWIWLQQAFPPGSRKPMRLNRDYPGGVREFCEGGPRLWNVRRDLTDKEAETLRDFSLTQAEARLEYAQKLGWQVLTPVSPDYPRLLLEIADPPSVLYVLGTLPRVDEFLSVAVAGSRKAEEDSLKAARSIAHQLAMRQTIVVSGGARGVDSAALSGAMLVPDGQVISVLPVSLDSNYVSENARLRRNVVDHGALVSEYFSQKNPERGTFQERNRVITGLSRGVVLIQAALRSGSMIYARHALEQNRDVFVYPGPAGDERFAGSRALIEDGAKPVTTGEQVLNDYAGFPVPQDTGEHLFEELFASLPPREKAPAVNLADVGAQLSREEWLVLDALDAVACSVGELEERTGLSAGKLLGLLTGLEVEGLAESLPGKRYRLGELLRG